MAAFCPEVCTDLAKEVQPSLIHRKSLSGLGERLTVLEGAEFREPESCWAVPVVCEGRIVAHLKIRSRW